MADRDGGWIALFSGGKESSWALHRALESGLDVRRLVLVHPPTPSSSYHAPGTPVIRLAARSIGIPLVDAGLPAVDVEPPDIGVDSIGPEDAEIEPLEPTLRSLDADLDGGVAGVVVGTVADEHRAAGVRATCDRVGCDVHAPLWRAPPRELAKRMIDGGLEIRILQVTAPGFDESWLGRRLDRDALSDLVELNRESDVHLLGEGGEYETIVTDGPHMACPIVVAFRREWHGTWGRLRIANAWLDAPAAARQWNHESE
ncbi:diphthine--ammonia ligase [Halobacteria archaeon AArc-curdl1]|uniref:Diphthine--ammonia ligase n=1 Tax=Natronosalvus hydrolyticus TaxID=2979988 RepID=A0AAP2Z4X2_9EURY|nr:diphthine--ammonia ligase [Halobacteria archaeon AArc-curdl1]